MTYYPSGAAPVLVDPRDIVDEPPEGWDALDEAKIADYLAKHSIPRSPEQIEMRQRIARVFSTPEGRVVLDWLVATLMDPPTFDWTVGESAVQYGFFREGQRDLVRKLRDVTRQVQETGQ